MPPRFAPLPEARGADSGTASIPRPARGLEFQTGHRVEGTVVVSLPPDRFFELNSEAASLLKLVDGRRDVAALALEFGRATGRTVAEEAVARVLAERLAPIGLVAWAPSDAAADAIAGDEAIGPTAAPGTGGTGLDHLPGSRTRALAGALRWLHHPRLAPPLALLALGLLWPLVSSVSRWIAEGSVLSPAAWLPAIVATWLSIGWHELGHASALASRGQPPGAIGIRFRGILPVPHADVSRAWLLGRWDRVAVDLGGVYFQLLFAAAAGLLHAATGADVWARIAALVVLNAFFNLSPTPGVDGHWALCDALEIRAIGQRATPWLRRGAIAQLPPLPAHVRLLYWIAQAVHAGLLAALVFGIAAPAIVRGPGPGR
jgi:putative peptide zinc metalloprotease protein